MTAPFETLRVWHDARRLTRRIYSASQAGLFARDYGLGDQIRRAAISVMSNIAEGHERGGARERAQYFRIAKGSVGELRSQLYIAEDAGYLDEQSARELRYHATHITRQLIEMIRLACVGPSIKR